MMFRSLCVSTLIAALSLSANTTTPAETTPNLKVDINPVSPKLGESIAVIIDPPNNLDASQARQLTVSFTKSGASQAANYPVFPLDAAGDRYRALIPTSPLDHYGKTILQVNDGSETRNLAIWLQNRSFPIQHITLTGKANSDATQYELDRVAALKALVTPTKYWHGAFRNPSNARISTIFGIRRYYNGVFANDYYHRGIDYAGNAGSPVIAPAAGKIALIGYEKDGFKVHGNVIGIDHGQGVISIFMHLSSISSTLKTGDLVQAGQQIGKVGSTGAAAGPHLHWGLYVDGVAIDPKPWLNQAID